VEGFKSKTAEYYNFSLPVVSAPDDKITHDCFLGSGESGQVYTGFLNGSKAALKVRSAFWIFIDIGF
jgi:hypothetical protein